MSVINKMLRDLDQQAPPTAREPARASPALSVIRGTASVAPPAALPERERYRLPAAGLALAALLVLLAGLGGWWWVDRGNAPPVVASAAPSQPPVASRADVATAASVSLPVQQQAPSPEPSLPVAVPPLLARPPETTEASATASLPNLSAESGSRAASRNAAVPARPADAGVAPAQAAPAAGPSVAARAPATAVVVTERPDPPRAAASAQAAVAAAPTMVARTEAPAAPTWQEAAVQALGQAQRLWASGARDPAIALLSEALPVLERSRGAEPTGAGQAVALGMVRELVRMEMAQGQHEQVLALLRRHEVLLAGQADLWAIRGNAAQRLAQHVQAAQAYQTALRLRPGEPRWMLGAAISLAAQGQLAPAAELAEQARGLAEVQPEVLAYLRQLGVTLRER